MVRASILAYAFLLLTTAALLATAQEGPAAGNRSGNATAHADYSGGRKGYLAATLGALGVYLLLAAAGTALVVAKAKA